MACKEESHGFVADLFVGHPAAIVFVLCQHQHREQVARVLAGAAAFVDYIVDHFVERFSRPFESN